MFLRSLMFFMLGIFISCYGYQVFLWFKFILKDKSYSPAQKILWLWPVSPALGCLHFYLEEGARKKR